MAESEAPVGWLLDLIEEFEQLPSLERESVGLGPDAVLRLRALGDTEWQQSGPSRAGETLCIARSDCPGIFIRY